MGLLDDIRDKFARREYEFSKHALDQTIARGIGVFELEQAVANRSNRGLSRGQVLSELLGLGIHKCRPPAAHSVQLSHAAADQDYHRVRTRSGTVDWLADSEDGLTRWHDEGNDD